MQTDANGHERLAKRRRYRWGYFGSVVAAVAGLWLAMALGYPLVGIGVYWLGALSMFGFLWLSPMRLFDERERELEWKASARTLQVFAFALIFGFPGLVALEEVGIVTISPWLNGAFAALLGMFVVFAVTYVAYRIRA